MGDAQRQAWIGDALDRRRAELEAKHKHKDAKGKHKHKHKHKACSDWQLYAQQQRRIYEQASYAQHRILNVITVYIFLCFFFCDVIESDF